MNQELLKDGIYNDQRDWNYTLWGGGENFHSSKFLFIVTYQINLHVNGNFKSVLCKHLFLPHQSHLSSSSQASWLITLAVLHIENKP